MRELRVEDALVYLDQVKVEFGDRPHIYNEFLEIMKTFKSQQIDTPGVIRRVSNLFQGNKKLVLGFNTFLPEGYKIEPPIDGEGPPVFRAPGQEVAQVLSGPTQPPVRPESSVASAPSIARRERDTSQGSITSKPKGPVPHPPGPTARKDSASLSQHQIRMPQPPIRHGGAAGPQMHHQQHSPQTNPTAPPRGHQGHSMMIKTSSDQTSAVPGPAPYPQRPQVPSSQPIHSYPPQTHRVQQPQTKPLITSETSVRPNPNRGAGPVPGRVMHHRTQNVAPAGVGTPPMPSVGHDGKPPVNSSRIGSGPPLPMPPQPQGSGQVSAPLPTGGPQRPIHNQAAPQQAQQQPLEFDHAINYVTMIKKRFASEPETYKKFLEILHTYQREMRGIKEVLDEVSVLFADHPDLLEQFTYFLPEAVQAQAKAQLDQVVEEAEARKRASMPKQPVRPPEGIPKPAIRESSPPPQPQPPAPTSAIRRPSYTQPAVLPVPFGATQGRQEERERDICRSAQCGVVSFAPVRPPRRNQPSPALAASKNGRPTAIPPLPRFPNTAETSFFQRARDHLNRKELAPDKPPGSRRHTPYTEFLKCLHLFGSGILTKTELVMLLRGLFMQGHAPKSGANAGGGVSNPAVASDAHSLMREFEEILVGRGPYAQQEAAFKDKSKYGSLRTKDFDYSNCEVPTPSYRTYPTDYPHCLFLANPGQSEEDSAVLNNQLVCVGSELNVKKTGTRSIEDYDCIRIRHNAYEEAMFRIEDERYEVDMAIERNGHAMRQIEPFADEVTTLKENEEKDGQPIGRLQYKLNKYSMNTIHINAIARVYGECGDEVLQHLVQNPLVVLPLVYQRLRQKDAEWRKAKLEMTERWNSLCEANYEGSLDHTCFPQRMEFERMFSPSRLLDDCQRAHFYYKHPEKLKPHIANSAFGLEYAVKNSDPDALLFQSHMAVKMGKIAFMSHRDAIRLLTAKIKTSSFCSDNEREKVGRIWAEFMVPWFGLPVHWVAQEVRQSFRGRLGPNVVKYSPGQNVVTDYGQGQILAFLEGHSAVEARYRVKFDFGVAFLRPSSIMHLVAPSDGTTFVRKDGVMTTDENAEFAGQALFAEKLSSNFRLMFGTEGIYIFLRLYCLLLSLLTDTREYLSIANPKQDPGELYYNPMRTESKKSATPSRLDYVGITTNLLKVCMNQLDGRNFETYCRRVSKTRVAQLAVLPKLVDSCAEALVHVANEDTLLALYDYCRHQELDPVQLHAQCTVLTPNACYRIQNDSVKAHMFFSYIPAGEDLLTAPRDDDSFMKAENGDDAYSSVQSEGDAGEAKSEGRLDFADVESSRPLKKAKLK